MNKRQYMQKTYERQRLLNKMMATPGPYPFVVILDHLKVDFNIGKIIRSAEAFGAMGVDVVGTPFFDPMPAKGCMKRVPWSMTNTFIESYQKHLADGFTFYAFDSEAELGIHEINFPEKSAFVLGHEGSGFSFKKEHYPAIKYVKIPQIGKVESLNVAVAASIVMYEFARSRNFKT
ncbi:MAG: TrmH family RNA methyltransferase [Bdellovibrionota bacterium]